MTLFIDGPLSLSPTDIQRLWVNWGQCCLRVAAGPCLPNGPITQLSPYMIRNPCRGWPLGPTMCIVSVAVRWMVSCVGYFQLSLIAFSRFILLKKPREDLTQMNTINFTKYWYNSNFSIGRAIFQGSAAKIPNACMWVLGILIVLPRGCCGLDWQSSMIA